MELHCIACKSLIVDAAGHRLYSYTIIKKGNETRAYCNRFDNCIDRALHLVDEEGYSIVNTVLKTSAAVK